MYCFSIVIHPRDECELFFFFFSARCNTCIAQSDYNGGAFSARSEWVFSITEERELSRPQRIICLDLVGSILSSYCFATGGYLLWRGFVGVHFPPG